MVIGSHKTPEVPKNEVYPGLFSMETIRVSFVLPAMNDLEVCAADTFKNIWMIYLWSEKESMTIALCPIMVT